MRKNCLMRRLLSIVLILGLLMGNGTLNVLASDLDTTEPLSAPEQQVADEPQATEESQVTEEPQATEDTQSTEKTQITEKSQPLAVMPLAEGNLRIQIEVDSQGNFLTTVDDIRAALNSAYGEHDWKYNYSELESIPAWGALEGAALNPDGIWKKIDNTPNSETEIQVGYKKNVISYEKYTVTFVTVQTAANENVITVTSEHGTVSGNKYVNGQVSVLEGETVSLAFKPDNNYYISKITIDETEFEPEYANGTATVNLDADQAMQAASITAEYTPMFVLNEGEYEVSMKDGADLSAIRTLLEESILDQAMNRDASAEMDTVNVKFKSIFGTELTSEWVNLDQQYNGALGAKGHKFGSNNPEKVQLSFDGNDRLPQTSVEISVHVNIVEKEPSSLVFNDINLTYGDSVATQKEQILNAINREESVLPENVTVDDLKVEYKFKLSLPFVGDIELPNIGGMEMGFFELKDGSMIPAGTQTIKVTYKGNSDYAECTTEPMQINVAKAKASVAVNSQTINYGEEFTQVVTTTPEGVSTLTIITGMDASINPYVSVILPELKATHVNTGNATIDSIINAGIDEAVKAANSALDSILNSGGTLKDTLTAICNNKELAAMIGIDLSSVEQLLAYLPDGVANIQVNVNKLPENAGVYAVAAITLDPNYETAFGVGGLVINMDTNHELGWNEELPLMLNWKQANMEHAYDFNAHFKEADVTAEIKYEFYGFSNDGKFHTNTKPILEPGIYTEVAYLYLGNQYSAPIIRKYTVGRMHTIGENLNPEKTYDGQPMDLNQVFKLTGEDGVEITDGTYEVVYYYNETTHRFEKNAPTDAGTYKVMVMVCGDAFHRETIVCGTFTIHPREMIVEIQDATKTYGDEDPAFTYVVKDSDGNVSDIEVSVKLSRESGENIGDYEITGVAEAVKCANTSNYKVTTVIPGTLTITKRPIVVKIDDKTKRVGQDDPEFTSSVITGNLVYDDTLTIEFTREEGETVGKYVISPKSSFISDNYDLSIQNGTLTIYDLEQLFTVTYTDGLNGSVFEDQIYNGLKLNTETPAFDGTPTREGYIFKGWTPEVTDTVTENAVYTATWEKVKEDPTPENPTDDKTGDNNTGNDNTGNDNKTEVSDSPKTGDTSHGMMWMILLLGASFVGILTVRRKRTN